MVTSKRLELDKLIEEGDMRVIPSIAKSVESGLKK